MTDLLVVFVACASVPPLISNLRALSRSGGGREGSGAGVFGVVVLVLGGLLYDAKFVPTGQPAQLVVLGLLIMSFLLLVTASDSSDPRRSRRFHLGGVIFWPSAVAGIMFLSNALMNPELPLEQSLGRLLAVSILILAGLGASISRIPVEDICRIIVVSVLFILVATAFRPDVWRACDIFKCGPFGEIFTGPFSSENALAIYACIGILCVLASWSGLISFLTLIPLALTLYATESRTSQAALAGAIGIWLLLIIGKKAAGASFDRKRLASQGRFVFLLMSVLFAAGFYLLVSAEPSTFSNRGNIWIRALGALDGDWWRGLGLDRWSYLQSIGVLPLLFPHSQYLLLLFGGGVVAVGFLFIFFATVIWSSTRSFSSLAFASSYIVFLSILGWTEAYWNPIAFDGHTFLVLPLIFLLAEDRAKRVQYLSHYDSKTLASVRSHSISMPSTEWRRSFPT